jgi:hypothetical protein
MTMQLGGRQLVVKPKHASLEVLPCTWVRHASLALCPSEESYVQHSDRKGHTVTTIGALMNTAWNIVQSRLNLAQAEMSAKCRIAGIAAALVVGAALCAVLGFIGTIVAAIVVLSLVVPVWAALLIFSAVLSVCAAILAIVARGWIASALPLLPQRTIEVLRNDAARLQTMVGLGKPSSS